MTAEEVSEICKALGDSNRLKIITLLTKGELCACKILEEFNITQPTLSHHMKVLSDCNLVNIRKEGKYTYYSIHCCTFKAYKAYFEAIECYKDLKKKTSADNEDCCCGGE